MTHRFTALLAGLILLASSHPALAQSPSVDILVGGTPLPRYAHAGRSYVEALKGREYAIRLHNPYAVRVAVALSVDGLNTIDARRTAAVSARKWVLEPHQTITISGWQTSRSEARRFEFTSEQNSYAQALGKAENLGLISAVFFREKVAARVAEPESSDARARSAPAAPQAAPPPSARQESQAGNRANDELAATGMGRRVDHAVTQVAIDLEDRPAHAVDIRYEYRPQLVSLGILPATPRPDRLRDRERARGFDDGFSPVPPRFR